MNRYVPYGALVLLLLLALWVGRSCATTATETEDQVRRQQVHDTATYLRQTRAAFEATMSALNDERAAAHRLRVQMETQVHVHVRRANAHADTAATLQTGLVPNDANPWYVVAIQRQREAEQERLARMASDSAVDAVLREVDALTRANVELAARLATAEGAALVADTALTRTEHDLRRAKRQLGIIKIAGAAGALLLLLTR